MTQPSDEIDDNSDFSFIGENLNDENVIQVLKHLKLAIESKQTYGLRHYTDQIYNQACLWVLNHGQLLG